METVNTFTRYTSITGRDPFDDLRLLSFYESLFRNDIEYEPFITLLSDMLSAILFAKSKDSISEYEQSYDFYKEDGTEMGIMDASETLMKSFEVIGDGGVANDNVSKPPSSDDLSILDEDERRLLKHQASRKKNSVMVLLSNAIQVGASLDVIMDMEYTQAVNFINYRAELLEKQHKQSKNK